MKKSRIDAMKEKMFPAIISERYLAKDWNSEEEEKVWKKLKSKK